MILPDERRITALESNYANLRSAIGTLADAVSEEFEGLKSKDTTGSQLQSLSSKFESLEYAQKKSEQTLHEAIMRFESIKDHQTKPAPKDHKFQEFKTDTKRLFE